MLNISVLNTILIIFIVITGILIAAINNARVSVMLLSVMGILMSLEFLVLKAYRIAIIELVVGIILIPVLFTLVYWKRG